MIKKVRLYKYVIAYGFYFAKNRILYYSDEGNMIYFYIYNIRFEIFNPKIGEDIIIWDSFHNLKLTLNNRIYNNIIDFLNKKIDINHASKI